MSSDHSAPTSTRPLFPSVERLEGPGLSALVHRGIIDVDVASRWFAELRATLPWLAETKTIYGQQVEVPRLTSWHGDAGTTYTYSGTTYQPHAWTPALSEIRRLAEEVAATTFNSALANCYRHGHDGVAWHADDEPELGPEPVIASVSLGATRRFQMRRIDGSGHRIDLELHDGDVMVMAGQTQQWWRHRVPKQPSVRDERINVTFRRTHAYSS